MCIADPGAGISSAFDVVSQPLDKCRFCDLIMDCYTQAGLFDHLLNGRHDRVTLLIRSELGMFLESILKKQVEGADKWQLFCHLHNSTMWLRVTGNSDYGSGKFLLSSGVTASLNLF